MLNEGLRPRMGGGSSESSDSGVGKDPQGYHRHHPSAGNWNPFFCATCTKPALAADPRTSVHYNAACAAALAGCGQGKDADQSDEKERGRLRRQALDWL